MTDAFTTEQNQENRAQNQENSHIPLNGKTSLEVLIIVLEQRNMSVNAVGMFAGFSPAAVSKWRSQKSPIPPSVDKYLRNLYLFNRDHVPPRERQFNPLTTRPKEFGTKRN